MADDRRPVMPDSVMKMRRMGGGGQAGRFAPAARARDARGTLRNLLGVYRKEGRGLLLIFLLLLGSGLVLLLAPRLIGLAVDEMDALPQVSAMDAVTALGTALLGGYALDWMLSTAQGFLMAGVTQRIVRRLRQSLFGKLQCLPLAALDTLPHGELMSRITNDVDSISATIAASTSQLMSSVVMVLGSAGMMVVVSPPLALVTLVTTPLVALLTRLIARRSRKLFSGQQTELGRLNGVIEESISGLRAVKAFGQEGRIIGAFEEVNRALLDYATGAQVVSGFLMPMMNVITNLGTALVVGAGGMLAVGGHLAVGAIASFVTYSRLFIRPLNEIAGTFNQMQSALAGAERVFELLAGAEERPDAPDARELDAVRGDVRFEDVSFAYAGCVPVLKNVTFSVKRGETVALVGKTGAGKTTLVNLLTRFYDLTEGKILIDGGDILAYTRASLRHAFTVVPQDSVLFSGTILDNIRYGKPEATEKEAVEAARAAGAHSFISRLPQGYETEVSSGVDPLSQGQRQLIAIARAMLRPAPILILDEATSHVDSSTERRIQDALLRFRKGRTSFVIAHRLSTIRDADRILVLDDGRVAESGSHAELIALGGVYAQMAESQMDGI